MAGCMLKTCFVLGSFLAFSSAAAINCSDLSVGDCKNNFFNEISQELKEILTSYRIETFKKVIDFLREVVAELPADDPYLKKFQDASNDLERINNEKDLEKVSEMMLMAEQNNVLFQEERFRKAVQSHAMKAKLQELEETIMKKIFGLYYQLYDELRPEDIKAFPIYEEYKEIIDDFADVPSGKRKLGDLIRLMAQVKDLFS